MQKTHEKKNGDVYKFREIVFYVIFKIQSSHSLPVWTNFVYNKIYKKPSDSDSETQKAYKCGLESGCFCDAKIRYFGLLSQCENQRNIVNIWRMWNGLLFPFKFEHQTENRNLFNKIKRKFEIQYTYSVSCCGYSYVFGMQNQEIQMERGLIQIKNIFILFPLFLFLSMLMLMPITKF